MRSENSFRSQEMTENSVSSAGRVEAIFPHTPTYFQTVQIVQRHFSSFLVISPCLRLVMAWMTLRLTCITRMRMRTKTMTTPTRKHRPWCHNRMQSRNSEPCVTMDMFATMWTNCSAFFYRTRCDIDAFLRMVFQVLSQCEWQHCIDHAVWLVLYWYFSAF